MPRCQHEDSAQRQLMRGANTLVPASVNIASMKVRSFAQFLFVFVLAAGSREAIDVAKSVKAPAGWNVTLFAAPPDVGGLDRVES